MVLILLSQLIVPNKEPWRMCMYASTSMLLLQNTPSLATTPISHPILCKQLWQCRRQKTYLLAYTQPISAMLIAELCFWLQYCHTSLQRGKEGLSPCWQADPLPQPSSAVINDEETSQACPRKLTACLCISFHSGPFLRSHQKVSAVR